MNKASSIDINVLHLPVPKINYNTIPLLKTEFLLLFRKGNKWLWLLTIIGMAALIVLPIKIAHQMVLPILWFFQVSRLSDLCTKEVTNNVHYFTCTAYKPIRRLLFSQLLSAVVLMLLVALPLIIRLGLTTNFTALFSVLVGGAFLVLLASTLGMLSGGKKLFEVLFFMITYANISGLVAADYFGGFEHQKYYLLYLSVFTSLLATLSFLKRKYDLTT